MKRLKTRRGVRNSSDPVEITLCGCEIDPLTSSGHFYQLLCMIGLPTIPVLVLAIYSSIKLAASVGSYGSLDGLRGVFPVVLSTVKIVSAIEAEMTGVASYVSSNRSEILGSLTEVYETTGVALDALSLWPTIDGRLELISKENFIGLLESHRFSNGGQGVLDAVQFYDGLAGSFADWASSTILDRMDPRIWVKMYAFDSLSQSVRRIGMTRALGTAFFYRGSFADEELARFIASSSLGEESLDDGVIFDSKVGDAYSKMNRGSGEIWKTMKSLQASISSGVNGVSGSARIVDGTIWFRCSSFVLESVDSLLVLAVDDILDFIGDRQEELRRLIAFYAVSIGIMLFFMVPVSVSMALTTTGSLMSYVKTMERKSVEIKREKRKTERLLNEMLPRAVAYLLRKGEQIEAEQYQSVTVLFSDIADFTDISITSVPFDIVHFLNDLYNFIDAQIIRYDVYKVETISSVYMVSSGIPSRNGERHCIEIARLSIDLMKATNNYIIPHMPGHELQLRIGIHTGPCVGGVVGNKMPRYCLFGDTVNTASRMQSNGLPRRIHLSQSTYRALTKLGGFKMELRGEVNIKGKGLMVTYWLTGKDDATKSSTAATTESASTSKPLPSSSASPPGLINNGYNIFEETKKRLDNLRTTSTENTPTDDLQDESSSLATF